MPKKTRSAQASGLPASEDLSFLSASLPISESPPRPFQFLKLRQTCWLKDITGTAKCNICDQKVSGPNNFALVCNLFHCKKRICRRCASGENRTEQGLQARDRVLNGCWCQYAKEPRLAKLAVNPHYEFQMTALPKQNFQEDCEAHSRAAQMQANLKAKKNASASGDTSSADGVSRRKRASPAQHSERSKRIRLGPAVYFGDAASACDLSASFTPAVPAGSGCNKSSLDGSDERSPLSANFTDAAFEDDDSAYLSALPEPERMDNSEKIIIIGAGIIGLMTAFELAKAAKQYGKVISVTVIDVKSGPFEGASRRCAGLVTLHGTPEPIRAQQGRIWETWEEFLREATTDPERVFDWRSDKRVFRFRPVRVDHPGQRVLTTGERPLDEETGEHASPAWLKSRQNVEGIPDDENTLGFINVTKSGRWLVHQCTGLGVKFMFYTRMVQARTDPHSGALQSIVVRTEDYASYSVLSCDKVILAAGYQTPQILAAQFPHSNLSLNMRYQFSEWMALKSNLNGFKDRADISELPDEDPHFQADWRVVTRQGTRIRRYTAYAVSKAPFANVTPSERSRDTTQVRRFKDINLNDGFDGTTSERVEEGGRLVSSQANGMPVITSLSTSQLHTATASTSISQPSGVFLCFGFGNYGTTVAPLVAKEMVGLVIDGEDASLMWFSQPPDSTERSPSVQSVDGPVQQPERESSSELHPMDSGRPTPERPSYAGKGKGRAMEYFSPDLPTGPNSAYCFVRLA